MMQKAEAVQTAIDALAAKLAVPVTHLWEVLTRQAKIQTVIAFVWLAIAAGLWFAWWRVLNWIRANEDRYDIGSELFGVIGGIAMVVTSLCVLNEAANAIGYLFNPEYFALKQILGALK